MPYVLVVGAVFPNIPVRPVAPYHVWLSEQALVCNYINMILRGERGNLCTLEVVLCSLLVHFVTSSSFSPASPQLYASHFPFLLHFLPLIILFTCGCFLGLMQCFL